MIKRPYRADALLVRDIEDELIAVDSRSGEAYLLNEMGAAILDFCDGQTEVEAIVTEIVGILGGDRDVVAVAVRSFVDDLEAKGLLEESPTEDAR
jgi:hypothetical protein